HHSRSPPQAGINPACVIPERAGNRHGGGASAISDRTRTSLPWRGGLRSRGFRNGEKRGGELNAITGLFHALGIAVGSRRAETRGLRRISGPVVAAAMALGTIGCASVDGSAGRNDRRDDDEIVSENDPLAIVNR